MGPSPLTPPTRLEAIDLNIDNDAATAMLHFTGDLKPFDVFRYDVTSLGAQMRAGGAAAIIGVGGGRDVIICAANGFRRIVGIEVNSAIVYLDTRRFACFSGFDKIPGFELHSDEGRSYLTRTDEKFDMIQASLVDTWAATSAGAMTLAENSLYTVDAWQVFYRDLKPGGLITFSRWYLDGSAQTDRLFSVAWGMLLSEGVANPSDHIALVSSDNLATILVSNQPFSDDDLRKLRSIADQMKFKILFPASRRRSPNCATSLQPTRSPSSRSYATRVISTILQRSIALPTSSTPYACGVFHVSSGRSDGARIFERSFSSLPSWWRQFSW